MRMVYKGVDKGVVKNHKGVKEVVEITSFLAIKGFKKIIKKISILLMYS